MSYTDDSPQKVVIQTVNRQLEQRGYRIIEPIRLSYETGTQAQLIYQGEVNYQGLTKVNRDKQDYMVKWQLRSVKIRQPSSLDAEITTIKQLHQTGCHWPNQRLKYEPLAIETIKVNHQLCRFNGLVMPFVELGSLNSYLKGHTLSAQSKLQLAMNMAKSIQQLHQAGWVHGDIKPSNFLLSQSNLGNSQLQAQNSSTVNNNLEPVTYLNDWAYARQLAVIPEFDETTQLDKGTNLKSSRIANIRGTPAYLAPECWHGQPISIQSDLYAFGVTLFELFAAQKPYSLPEQAQEVSFQKGTENSSIAIREQASARIWARLHCQKTIPLLPCQWQSLQPIIDKLLAKRTQNRYQTMDELIQALSIFKKAI